MQQAIGPFRNACQKNSASTRPGLMDYILPIGLTSPESASFTIALFRASLEGKYLPASRLLKAAAYPSAEFSCGVYGGRKISSTPSIFSSSSLTVPRRDL